MPDRFLEILGRQLFVWSGWVFTVGGAAGGFVLGEGYSWIGWLAVLTGLLALTGHSYSTHRRCRDLEAENARATVQLREAERKLNEVPLDILNRIRELVKPQSLAEAAAQLAAHADYVLRMRRFVAAAGDVHLRTFSQRDGVVFATAKIPTEALSPLREKDVFILVRTADGLRTDCAVMAVHQTPDPAHGVVHFRLTQLLSDDVRAIETLAAAREVTGLTGYTLRPVCDAGWYAALDSTTIPEAITRLAEGLDRERRTDA